MAQPPLENGGEWTRIATNPFSGPRRNLWIVWPTIVGAGLSSSFENLIQKRLNRNR